MTRTRRGVGLALGCLALVLVLPGCRTGSWSSSCDSEGRCRLEISGTQFHDLPRSLDSRNGMSTVFDKIRLAGATAGGTATVQVGGADNVCRQGESFVQHDVRFTCTEVGDDSIVLDTAPDPAG